MLVWLLVNLFATAYGIYVLVWLPFPPSLPVTSVNMNCSRLILGRIIGFALMDWAVWDRRRFVAPVDVKDEFWWVRL